MDRNVIEQIVVPHNPPPTNVVQRNQYNLFAPMGGINKVGMVGYSAEDFEMNGNILSLLSRIRTPLSSDALKLMMRAVDYNNSVFDLTADWIAEVEMTFSCGTFEFLITGKGNQPNNLTDFFENGITRYASQIFSSDEHILSVAHDEYGYTITKLVLVEAPNQTYYDIAQLDESSIQSVSCVCEIISEEIKSQIDDIKQNAVSSIDYDASTDTLTFKALNGNTVKTIDLIQTSMLTSVELVNENELVFTFRLHDGGEERITFLIDEMLSSLWIRDITDSLDETELNIPPTTGAVVDYAALKERYLDGKISNNTDRILNLERMANGYLYRDVTLEGKAESIQLPKVCDYGILSKASGNLQLISIFLPYSLAKATNVSSYTLNSYVSVAEKAVYIPCNISPGTEVTVRCDGYNDTEVTGFGLFSAPSGSSAVIGKTPIGTKVTPNNNVSYIYVYTNHPTKTPAVKNLQVIFSDPTDALREISSSNEPITSLGSIRIPDEIRSLSDYGDESVDSGVYNYIDFTNKTFVRNCSNGTPILPQNVDISEFLDEDNISDVVELKPGCIIRFYGSDSFGEIESNYEISYKEMLL